MDEELYIQALREEIQGLRQDLHAMRETMTALRIAMATVAQSADLQKIEQRVGKLEDRWRKCVDDRGLRREVRQWIVPVIISVVSTLSVLGLKLWELSH